MFRVLILAALVTVIAAQSCDPHPHPYPEVEEGSQPVDGTWALHLEPIERRGDCADLQIELTGAGTPVMTLGHVDEELLALDIDGVHLEGFSSMGVLEAEGWAPHGFLVHEPTGFRLAIGVAIDATVDTPESMYGEMTLLAATERGECEIIARLDAWHDPSLRPDRGEGEDAELVEPVEPVEAGDEDEDEGGEASSPFDIFAEG